jgi:hypothetical protein
MLTLMADDPSEKPKAQKGKFYYDVVVIEVDKHSHLEDKPAMTFATGRRVFASSSGSPFENLVPSLQGYVQSPSRARGRRRKRRLPHQAPWLHE